MTAYVDQELSSWKTSDHRFVKSVSRSKQMNRAVKITALQNCLARSVLLPGQNGISDDDLHFDPFPELLA